MIKRYTLADGFSFETITIPKGTLLFRGIQFSDLTPMEHLSEFIGKGLCVPPTKNVYFYPAPYVSVGVNMFNVHILYTTNYDLELLLLVRPSVGFKPDGSEINTDYERIITICKKLSVSDGCGRVMSEDDPCFTPFFLETFPHILGYVGLDAGDVDAFFTRYKGMIRESMKNEIGYIIPSIVANARDIIGVPEIVLYPLHYRRNKRVRVKNDFKNPYTQIQNIIWNRAKWNYTPLLYISDAHIFSLNDLLEYKTLLKLMSGAFINKLKDNPIFKNIDIVLKGLASDTGYTINRAQYHMKLDLRTGFYRILSRGAHATTRRRPRLSSLMEFISEDSYDIKETKVEYNHSKLLTPKIIKDVADNYLMDMNEDYVNTFLHSFLHVGMFERGEFIKKYRIEEVFPRPDLSKMPRCFRLNQIGE